MNRTDRVLALFADLTIEKVIELDASIEVAEDAIAMTLLDIDLDRTAAPTYRELVDDFIGHLGE